MGFSESGFSGIATLLLSNVTGFQQVPEAVDPESLAQTVNTVFSDQLRQIQESGGVIVQTTGDATLAVWVPSGASPKHADLALVCARRMLNQMRQREKP